MDLWMLWDLTPLPARKVLVFLFGIGSLLGLPVGGFYLGTSIVAWNVAGRSPSESEQEARAGQWNWPTILIWSGLAVGAALFIFSMLYVFLAKKDKRSAWR